MATSVLFLNPPTPMATTQTEYEPTEARLWVFGYGSLLWKPEFSYNEKKVGFIHDYVRRFWQGNTTHRGTSDQPGRVAHLVKEEGSRVWGVAFEVLGQEAVRTAMAYLQQREVSLGGYVAMETTFYPRESPDRPLTVLVFSVTSANPLYLGPAPVVDMAIEIVQARGNAGPNTEYVTRLADFVRRHIPEDQDDHLFELDSKVRELEAEMNRRRRDSYVHKIQESKHTHIVTKSCPRGAMH